MPLQALLLPARSRSTLEHPGSGDFSEKCARFWIGVSGNWGSSQTHMGQGVGNQEQAEECAQGDKNPPLLNALCGSR